MHTAEARDRTPYFQVELVRKERTAEERAGAGFEMVGGKELKDEDFSGRAKGGVLLWRMEGSYDGPSRQY